MSTDATAAAMPYLPPHLLAKILRAAAMPYLPPHLLAKILRMKREMEVAEHRRAFKKVMAELLEEKDCQI